MAAPHSAPVRPLLKWAGGKRQLLTALRRFYPVRFRRYVEPFVGSGAVFFDLYNAGLLRQREAAPVWQSLGEWLEGPVATDVLPKSKLGEALRYLRNHWEPLRVYLSDGRLPIDNNDTEQLMKHVAIGRKNWLFVGSVAAGERAADFLTLVSSAVRNDLDVWAYIKDVLDRLLAGSTNYESLRPDIWRQAHPESIRQYRVDERRDRADRKQRRRADRRQLQG